MDQMRTGPLVYEASPRWVRVRYRGETIADSKRPILAWESGRVVPFYLFPRDAVRADVLREAGRDDGKLFYDLPGAERAAWSYTDAGELSEHVAFDWHAMDAWYEEEDEVFVHARDPHKRVDVLESSRHVVVSTQMIASRDPAPRGIGCRDHEGGVTLADTRRPRLLFETGLPTRYYIPSEDVRMDLLRPSEKHTQCPYKGTASYLSTETERDIAWFYPEPIPEQPRIEGLIAFFNERVDIDVDGEREGRPET
jgi:uncharacterized protein (DUF427 family)